MRYFLVLSLLINVWFQFRGDLMWAYMTHIKKCTGFSYTETYILKIPYDFECHGQDQDHP